MRATPFLIALAFTASHVAASTPNSLDAWIKEAPSCMQSCLTDVYHDVVGNSCGKDALTSTNPNEISCLCTTGNWGDATNADSAAQKCIVNQCGDKTNETLSQYSNQLPDLMDLCYSAVKSNLTGTSTAKHSNGADSMKHTSLLAGTGVVLAALLL